MTFAPLAALRRLWGRLRRPRGPRGPIIGHHEATQKIAAAFTREFLEELEKKENPLLATIKKKKGKDDA